MTAYQTPACAGRTFSAFVVVSALFAIPPLYAQEEQGGQQSAQENQPGIPLKDVTLFNSGVGYFEHRAGIEGDAALQLRFNAEDMNDLLKSLVVQDLGGGRISLVTYGSKAPLSRVLKTFAIDLTGSPTLADLLSQARGERVTLHAPNPINGKIISVETRKQKLKDDEAIEVQVLNLMTETGFRSVPFDIISSIELLDKELNAELQQALDLMAATHETDKKKVTLKFRGDQQRDVRVGYIQQTPVWKMTYRLVLRDDQAELLQGWAIVENTTEQDWSEVELRLISGRPVSYVMQLYEPLFVDRPEVKLDLYESLRPQTYEQDLQRAEQLAEPAAPARARRRMAAGLGGAARQDARPADRQPAREKAFDIQRGVQAVARAGDVGELFEYAIETPVSLGRQESAMLPVVNGSVKGEKVSIYDQSVHAEHPMDGVRLTNTTDLFLMEGPITVFDDGTYAGDALLENLQPGAERLISYALNLEVEVAPETKTEPQNIVSVSIRNGTLYSKHRQVREHVYRVKNTGEEAQTVLIQYPRDPNWELLAPEKPVETTRDSYRFAVKVKPSETEKLVVREEQVISQQVALTNLNSDNIVVYLNAQEISQEVKEALREIVDLQQEIQDLVQRRQQREQQVETIRQEQERIRKNMAEIDRNTELYSRYLKKLSSQEDQIEQLQEQIQELRAEERTARNRLEDYLSNLRLE